MPVATGLWTICELQSKYISSVSSNLSIAAPTEFNELHFQTYQVLHENIDKRRTSTLGSSSRNTADACISFWYSCSEKHVKYTPSLAFPPCDSSDLSLASDLGGSSNSSFSIFCFGLSRWSVTVIPALIRGLGLRAAPRYPPQLCWYSCHSLSACRLSSSISSGASPTRSLPTLTHGSYPPLSLAFEWKTLRTD